MMLISTILLSVVGLLAVEGANNCPGLKVTSPNTDEQNVDVNCTLLGTSSCRDPTNIPSHLLGSEFVGQPDFFEVVSDRTVPKGIADYLPRMNMTWRPAISGGDLRNLKGFLIYFHRLTPGTSSVLCRILDLHESKFSQVKTTFNFLLEKMRAETLYLVQIYGLPRPRNSNLFPDVRRQSFVYTQPRSGDNYEQRPKDWKSSISYQMDEEAGVINATFHLAPHHLNFTKYEVKLLDGNDILKSVRNKTVLQTDFMYGKVGFENVPAGNYSVSVQAVDVYFSDMSKCLCYSVEKSSGSRLCSQCLVSMTPPFVFNSSLGSPVPSPSSATPPEGATSKLPPVSHPASQSTDDPIPGPVSQPGDDSFMWKNALAAVLGVILALALLATVAVFLWRRRFKCQRDTFNLSPAPPSADLENEGTVSPPNNASQQVFLVYAEDHEAHVEAVECLAKYLQNFCQCKVVFAPWYTHEIQKLGMLRWIMNAMVQSDFILVVNSEAAYQLGHAWLSSQPLEHLHPSPTKDFFVTAFSRLCAKLVDCQSLHNVLTTHFDHTPNDYVLAEINQGIRYILPAHLAEVVKVILQLSDPSRPRPVVPPAPLYLLESIRKAASFEKAFPGWFRQRFRSQAVPTPVQRLDSGFDSLPRESKDSIGMEADDLGLDNPGIHLEFEGTWPVYSNMDECHTYYPPSEADFQSIYTFGLRQLDVPKEAEKTEPAPVGHLHVNVEDEMPSVYVLPSATPLRPQLASAQRSSAPPEAPVCRPDGIADFHGMPQTGNLSGGVGEDDLSDLFHPPLDPEMFDGTSISPSEALRRINLNSEGDWEISSKGVGGNFSKDLDACSGKSV